MDNLIDIESYQEELTKMNKSIRKIYHQFMALAMDYQFYKQKTFNDHDIYKLRDEVHYRFKSVRVQTQVLFQHQLRLNQHLQKTYIENKEEIFKDYWPSHPLFDQYQEEISSLFDGFIYHLTSIFDYIGNITNYMFGEKKQEPMNWNSLAKSSRDINTLFGKASFAETIKEIDRQFTTKLYRHRSFLIHERSDIFNSQQFISNNQKTIFSKFIASNKFVKNFSDLRQIPDEKFITIDYVVFWLFHKTIEEITKVLFSLKAELELKPEPINFGTIGAIGKDGRLVSPSEIYWKGIDPVEYEKMIKEE